jgi:Na+/H+-dicarboxylate symporter
MQHTLTVKIIAGMVLGIILGLLIQVLPLPSDMSYFISNTLFGTVGAIFVRLLKMLVVPIVFVSLVCGVCNLADVKSLGKLGVKTIALYLLTTAIAITLALCVASIFQVGVGLHLSMGGTFVPPNAPSPTDVLLNLFPTNPLSALEQGNMLQIIVFSLLLGAAIMACGKKAVIIKDCFMALNEIFMKLILMIMTLAPYGVFCLLFFMFSKLSLGDTWHLFKYFMVVILVLAIQLFVVYGGFLTLFKKGNIITFLKAIYPAMIFAFSTSSSSASIPVTLRTVRQRLGVRPAAASFVIPLGATINMDGTAIMQGVATVFIAHVYHVTLGLTGYLTVIAMATLASIGTAGVPGVGLLTLAMVLQQVGLPVEGIGLIIGVDRILDMLRTAVNVAGDSMVAKLVDTPIPVVSESVTEN